MLSISSPPVNCCGTRGPAAQWIEEQSKEGPLVRLKDDPVTFTMLFMVR